MFERGFSAETLELLKSFQPDFLDDVFDLALAAGVAPCGGKNSRRIFLDQRFEAGRVSLQHCGNQLRFAGFHCRQYAKAVAIKSKLPILMFPLWPRPDI